MRAAPGSLAITDAVPQIELPARISIAVLRFRLNKRVPSRSAMLKAEHEIAQVAGAITAVIGKMVRVMLLSAYVAKHGAATTSGSDKPGKTGLAIP